jgi:hypothetical protein
LLGRGFSAIRRRGRAAGPAISTIYRALSTSVVSVAGLIRQFVPGRHGQGGLFRIQALL